MESKTKRCVSRILALALVFALCLSMLGAAPGNCQQQRRKRHIHF